MFSAVPVPLAFVQNGTLEPDALWMTLAACLLLCPCVLILADRLSRPYETQRQVQRGSGPISIAACVILIAALFLASLKFSHLITLALMQALIAVLILLALIDARLKVLPNKVTIPLLIVGLGLSFTGYTVPWPHAVLGAITGFLMLLIPELLFGLLTGRRGVGFGDIKLMAAVGAWIGWPFLLHILIVAALGAAITGFIYLKAKKLDSRTTIPFGPFLALASIVFIVL